MQIYTNYNIKSFANVKWIHTVPSASLLPQGSGLDFVSARYGPWEVFALCANLIDVIKAFLLLKTFFQERSSTAHLRIPQWINYILALTYYGINWHIVTCVLLYIFLYFTYMTMCLFEFWLFIYVAVRLCICMWMSVTDVCMCVRVKETSNVWCLEDGSQMQDCVLPFVLFY